MPLIDAWRAQSSQGGVVDNAYLGTHYDDFLAEFATRDAWRTSTTGIAPYTNNAPVSAAGRPIVGFAAGSWSDDFYHRVHVIPSQLDIGNLFTTQSRTFRVWNAYLDSAKTLASVSESGTEGILITAPASPPTVFATNEERQYAVSVTLNGPPVIDAAVLLVFEAANSPTVTITGRRIVVWPWVPQVDYRETLEWQTDVIQAFAGEQRIALRTAPRQGFDHRYYLQSQDLARAQAVVGGWAHRLYGLPMFGEASNVGALTAGLTQLLVDTAHADYRAGGMACVWASPEQLEVVEISQVLVDRLVLVRPLATSYAAARVMPLRVARTLRGVEFDRVDGRNSFAAAQWSVTDNAELAGATTLDAYRGADVLSLCRVMVSPISDRIARSVDVFDNGSGIMDRDVQSEYVTRTSLATFHADTRAQRWALRVFLDRIKGRQGVFWLVSGNADLQIAAPLSSGGNTLQVQPIGYPLYYGVTDICILLNDGTRIYRRVTSGAAVDGLEHLALDAAPGVTIDANNVRRIMFMRLYRLDADTVEIHHPARDIARAAVACKEVPA